MSADLQKALDVVAEQRAGVVDELQSVLQTIQLLNNEVKIWSESLAEQLKNAKDETLRRLNCMHNTVNALRVSFLSLSHLPERNASQCRRVVDWRRARCMRQRLQRERYYRQQRVTICVMH